MLSCKMSNLFCILAGVAKGFSSLMGLCIDYVFHFGYFSEISDNVSIVLLVKLGKWGEEGGMEIETIYRLNYSILDTLE